MAKRSFFIIIFILLTLCVKANYVDSLSMKCKQWKISKYTDMGKSYYCYIVQFIFENHSSNKKEFITDYEEFSNFIKVDNYILYDEGLNSLNDKSHFINPKSNLTITKVVLIPSRYIEQGNKRIMFNFIWVSGKEYKTKKYDNQILAEKKNRFKKIKKTTQEDYQGIKLLIERDINRHYKLQLIIKEKVKTMKDVLTCELVL